ncbi:MAG: hypothetical protein Q8K57_00880, partial [Thiobacillus sp.]|nr:hypothetical protein [Thiobacillus sp.]
MDYFWATGQLGIVIEILGAGTIVVSAYKSSRKIRQHKTDTDHTEDAIKQLMEDTRNQFKTQSIGFALLVVG